MAEGRELPPIPTRGPKEPRPRAPIGRAAGQRGCEPEDVTMHAATGEGSGLLLDQVFFPLDTQAFAAFQNLLDNPPAPTARLRRLMLTTPPWE